MSPPIQQTFAPAGETLTGGEEGELTDDTVYPPATERAKRRIHERRLKAKAAELRRLEDARLRIGKRVQVERDGTWVDAVVAQHESDGSYAVQFCDEGSVERSVERARLISVENMGLPPSVDIALPLSDESSAALPMEHDFVAKARRRLRERRRKEKQEEQQRLESEERQREQAQELHNQRVKHLDDLKNCKKKADRQAQARLKTLKEEEHRIRENQARSRFANMQERRAARSQEQKRREEMIMKEESARRLREAEQICKREETIANSRAQGIKLARHRVKEHYQRKKDVLRMPMEDAADGNPSSGSGSESTVVNQVSRAKARVQKMQTERRRLEIEAQAKEQREAEAKSERMQKDAERAEHLRIQAARRAAEIARQEREEKEQRRKEKEAADAVLRNRKKMYCNPKQIQEIKRGASPMPTTQSIRRRQEEQRRIKAKQRMDNLEESVNYIDPLLNENNGNPSSCEQSSAAQVSQPIRRRQEKQRKIKAKQRMDNLEESVNYIDPLLNENNGNPSSCDQSSAAQVVTQSNTASPASGSAAVPKRAKVASPKKGLVASRRGRGRGQGLARARVGKGFVSEQVAVAENAAENTTCTIQPVDEEEDLDHYTLVREAINSWFTSAAELIGRPCEGSIPPDHHALPSDEEEIDTEHLSLVRLAVRGLLGYAIARDGPAPILESRCPDGNPGCCAEQGSDPSSKKERDSFPREQPATADVDASTATSGGVSRVDELPALASEQSELARGAFISQFRVVEGRKESHELDVGLNLSHGIGRPSPMEVAIAAQ